MNFSRLLVYQGYVLIKIPWRRKNRVVASKFKHCYLERKNLKNFKFNFWHRRNSKRQHFRSKHKLGHFALAPKLWSIFGLCSPHLLKTFIAQSSFSEESSAESELSIGADSAYRISLFTYYTSTASYFTDLFSCLEFNGPRRESQALSERNTCCTFILLNNNKVQQVIKWYGFYQNLQPCNKHRPHHLSCYHQHHHRSYHLFCQPSCHPLSAAGEEPQFKLLLIFSSNTFGNILSTPFPLIVVATSNTHRCNGVGDI